MEDVLTSVNAFCASYRAAFERADVDAIADHFAFPCQIASEAREVTLTSIASREEGLRMVQQIMGMYRTIGFHSARVLDLTALAISPRLIQVLVRWALYDDAGTLLYRFEAAYFLARIEGALRICTIAHNEIPRYRECLAQTNAGNTGSLPS